MVIGDLVFVVAGNGADTNEDKVPAPKAPSFLAVNRQTGKVVWSDNSPGDRIVDGQWSAPCYGAVNGRPQVVFPGGDGWLYAFEPADGKPLWKFNCSVHLPAAEAADRKTRTFAVATPVFHDNKVFIATSTTPGTTEGPGCLWAIDATKTGDLTSAPAWKYDADEFSHSIATVAIADGLLYAVEMRGFVHCLEVSTGNPLWKYDLNAPAWASPMVADGKVYIGTEDGDVIVLAHGREAKLVAKNRMKEQVYATVTPANGVLYVVDRTHLYAIAEGAAQPESRPAASAPATQPASKPASPGSAEGGRDARPSVGDWPMFRGNPQLTGVATAEPPAKPEIRWKYRTGDVIESSAAVSAGSVYVGCNDGFLYCVDLASGDFKWKFKADGPIKSSPLVHAGVVYFGDDEGVFHAVDAKAGTSRWFYKTDGEIVSSANFAGGRLLFGSYDGNLYCLNESDGKLVWKFETEGRVHGTPGIVGDKVLVAGCDEHLRVVKLEDGTAAGQVKMGSFSGASAAVSGGRVFVGTFANQVLAIDWAGGSIAWTYEHAEPKAPFFASAAVRGDVVVVAERERLVHALNADTGKRRWFFDAKGRVDCSPVIAGERVFVGSTEGVFYALSLADGKPTWEIDLGAAITASPAVGESVVIGTDDGTLYCLGKP
jgi:outer membrane protein assembly factor BamB